MVQLEICRRFD